jgi:hypothetical protein
MSEELSNSALGSSHRKVTMQTAEDDEIIDPRNFQDIRMELQATGHNLVQFVVGWFYFYCILDQ